MLSGVHTRMQKHQLDRIYVLSSKTVLHDYEQCSCLNWEISQWLCWLKQFPNFLSITLGLGSYIIGNIFLISSKYIMNDMSVVAVSSAFVLIGKDCIQIGGEKRQKLCLTSGESRGDDSTQRRSKSSSRETVSQEHCCTAKQAQA